MKNRIAMPVIAGIAGGIVLVVLCASSVSGDIQAVSPPQAIVVNPETGKIYLVNYNGSISVADSDTRRIVLQIVPPETEQQEDYFQSIGVNERTNKLYASSGTRDLVFVVDGNSDKIIKEIPLDQYLNVMSIAVNPATNRIYAATYTNMLYVIDGSLDEIIERIDIGDHSYMSGDVGGPWPAELSVNPNTNLIYATNGGHDVIAVIDGSTSRIIANITIESPFAAIINPATDKLYVTHESSESVAVFDGSSYEMLGIIRGVETVSFKNEQIALDPSRNAIYISSYPDAGITMIDGISDRQIKTIKTDFPPVALEINPASGVIYVGMEGSNMIQEIESIGTIASVQVANKTYSLGYKLSNGDSITNITARSEFLGSIVIDIDSPSEGYLDLTFPRELSDAISFTDHPLAVFVDELNVDVSFTNVSCDQISVRIPLQKGSEEIEIVGGDILAQHTHPYPPRLELLKTIVAENTQFGLRILTDAVGCDVSFAKEKKLIHIALDGNTETTEPGYLKITIPHDLLDGNYTILVDGQRVNFTEQVYFTTNNTDLAVETVDDTGTKASNLIFGYPKDAKVVNITGTTAIPEFGLPVAVIILAASIAIATAAVRAYPRR